MIKRIIIVAFAFFANILAFAQDTSISNNLSFDPDRYKVIPDKVFELGLPFVLIILVVNMFVTMFKNRAENQLKLKMIEKGISEDALIKIFKESNAFAKLQPLKWFLMGLAMSLSLLIIHLFRSYLINQSGYLAISIILLFNSIAFFIYYNILSNK